MRIDDPGIAASLDAERQRRDDAYWESQFADPDEPEPQEPDWDLINDCRREDMEEGLP